MLHYFRVIWRWIIVTLKTQAAQFKTINFKSRQSLIVCQEQKRYVNWRCTNSVLLTISTTCLLTTGAGHPPGHIPIPSPPSAYLKRSAVNVFRIDRGRSVRVRSMGQCQDTHVRSIWSSNIAVKRSKIKVTGGRKKENHISHRPFSQLFRWGTCAASIVIFTVITTIHWLSFTRTKREDSFECRTCCRQAHMGGTHFCTEISVTINWTAPCSRRR